MKNSNFMWKEGEFNISFHENIWTQKQLEKTKDQNKTFQT